MIVATEFTMMLFVWQIDGTCHINHLRMHVRRFSSTFLLFFPRKKSTRQIIYSIVLTDSLESEAFYCQLFINRFL